MSQFIESFSLPAERASVRSASPELQARRAQVDARVGRERADVALQRVRFGDTDVLQCEPLHARCIVVYLHGGGFRLGSAKAWTGLGGRIAQDVAARVLLVDYRLAPEHPFPAGLRDVLVALSTVSDGDLPVILAGDSAGGGLAAAVTALRLRAGQAPPDGLVCLSGWLDLTLTAKTFDTNAETDGYFSRAFAHEAADSYLQGWNPSDPAASPLFADVSGFPPTLLCASTAEVLLDDTITFAGRLAEAQVLVRTVLRPGLPHAWPAIDADSSSTAATMKDIDAFVSELLGQPRSAAVQ